MKNTRRFATLILLSASFVFFSYANEASARVELGSSDPIPSKWTKENSPYIIKTIIQANNPVTIEPGVVVKFKSAASAIFNNSLIAVGTEKEKIVFTAYTDDEHGGDTNGDLDSTKPNTGYWYMVNITDYATAHFENALFLYGGEHPFGTLSIQSRSKKSVVVKSSEFKHNKYAGINIDYNPDQTIENNIFSDNAEGIILRDCVHGISATISGNLFFDNLNFGAKVTSPNYNTIDARNNWWGDSSGPYHPTKNINGKGDNVSNGILFDPWIGKGSNDPVIIIPGIMGSWKKDGEWQIDPIFHTYDNLYDEFVNEDYVPGKDLFTFPYEWRDSNEVNAVELKAKIQEIKDKTKFPQVDIVAHSMGGILAREYIESDYFKDDVDQLITVGTPHLGSPGVYIKWEAGESFWSIFDMMGKKIFQHEAKENNYSDVFHYIHERPVASVQELLPIYNYLYDVENSYSLRETYPNNYPRNEFLDNLNSLTRVQLLRDTKFTKIIGKVNYPESTVSGYNVIDANTGELWQHGYPHGFEIPISDQGLRWSDGDRTVPLYSAESASIHADRTITLESEHNALPTDAQSDILEILTGKRPTNEVREWRIDDIMLGMVFSPVDVQIEDELGRKIGKKFSADEEFKAIPGAFYSGFDESCPSEDEPDKRCEIKAEFFTIPDPIIGGEYKIVAEGTGEGGAYKIEMARITKDEINLQETVESSAIIEGIAEAGVKQEAKIEVTEDEVIYNPDTTPPAITNGSPNGELPDAVTETQISLQTDEKATCKYSTDPDIAFDSMPDDFTTSDGISHSVAVSDLKQWQSYNFCVKCRDETGNTNQEDYIISFKIPDTTPPAIIGAATSQPNANRWYDNDVTVHFSASDAESGIESVTPDVTISAEGANQSATGTATDKAGNSASFTVMGINIDKTSPVIKIVSPENKNYLNDNYALIFSAEINDPLSGVETSLIEKLLNNQLFEDEKLDLSLKNMGSYNYQVRAKDKAGNPGSAEMNFQVATDIDAIQNNINHYFDLGFIKKKIAKRYLVIRLAHLENLFNLLEKAKNSKSKPKPKQAAVDALKKVINMDIDIFIKQINRKSPRWIDPAAAEFLIESLKSMKIF